MTDKLTIEDVLKLAGKYATLGSEMAEDAPILFDDIIFSSGSNLLNFANAIHHQAYDAGVRDKEPEGDEYMDNALHDATEELKQVYAERDALRQQVAELRKLAYTYPPSEPFAPDGETWKQRAISDEAKLKKCREALEFYANPEVYRPDFMGQIRCPLQDKAQQTLKEIGGK